jgi:hypothetical protein
VTRARQTPEQPDASGQPGRPRHARRLWLTGLTVGALAIAVLVAPADPLGVQARDGSLRSSVEAAPVPTGATHEDEGGHDHGADDGHGHDHNDPATKNAISRGGEVSAQAVDPTTAAQAAQGRAHVARERALPDPSLRTVRVRERRRATPEDRYAMAGGCYSLRAPGGRYAARTATGMRMSSRREAGAAPITFRATDLGTYLLFGTERDFVAAPDARWAGDPSATTEWTVRQRGRTFLLRQGDTYLARDGRRVITSQRPARWRLSTTSGCTRYPESQVNVRGRPHAGTSSFQEVRGYVDAHTHGMAFEFLGGAHCGRPWHPYGPAYALVDCPDHMSGSNPLEAALSGEPTHDPVGWPTFKDWPAPNSLTHEGTYHAWMERAWRGGQRLFVNLLVENGQLCRLYPPVNRPDLTSVTCDEMESVKRQAQAMYDFQDYIDAQHGGPGEGWYRIVTSPFEARRVINAGKMAVVMGIETSVPFGCTYKRTPAGDVPECTADSIDAQLAEMHDIGVRQMELVNKFDNALSGVAGDEGETGVAVNSANFAETASYWDMRTCEHDDPEKKDRTQLAQPEISADQQDALFGAIAQLYGASNLPAVPVYPRAPHCNARGLTDLGAHLVDRLADRGMLIDPDHMSVEGRDALLDQLEERSYPGAISSHSWSSPDAYPRIYRLGGYIAPYAGDSTGFVEKWRRHLGWADDRFYFGFGFGADMNGLGAQGDPRGTDVSNPVTYPITGFNGVRIDRQRAGQRVYDINADGVAQYGLYPDWIEDIGQVAGADKAAITDDMARGAEAYLQTWERAEGVAADSCRNPGNRVLVPRFLDRVRPGLTTRGVMERVGQPWQRLGREFTYCARTPDRARVQMTVSFTRRGRVSDVRRG